MLPPSFIRAPSIPDFSGIGLNGGGDPALRLNRRSLSPSACPRSLYSPVLPTLSPWRLRECRLGNQSSQPSILSDGISVYSEYSELLCEPLRGVVLSSGLRITPMKKRPIQQHEWTTPAYTDSSDDTPNSLSPRASPILAPNGDFPTPSSSVTVGMGKVTVASTLISKRVSMLLGGVTDLRQCCQPRFLQSLSVQQLLVLANELHSHINVLNEELMSQLLQRDDLHLEQGARLIDVEDMSRRAQEAAKILLHSDQQHAINHQSFAAATVGKPRQKLAIASPLPPPPLSSSASASHTAASSSSGSSASSYALAPPTRPLQPANIGSCESSSHNNQKTKSSKVSIWGRPQQRFASFFTRRN